LTLFRKARKKEETKGWLFWVGNGGKGREGKTLVRGGEKGRWIMPLEKNSCAF